MKLSLLLLIILWASLAVITGLFDLQISIFLFNSSSGWAIFLENYGMLPGLIVLIFAANIYYLKISKENSFLFYLKKIFLFLTLSFFYFYLIAVIVHLFDEENFLLLQSFLIITVLSFAISLGSLIVMHFLKFKPDKKLFNFSKMSLMLGSIGYLIFIQLIKTIWGRVRFRELNIDYSNFTNWFEPQGITGFDSFPSGHAAMACMVLPVMLLIKNNSRYTKFFIAAIIITWAIMVSFSRVVIGAHYVSDVMFASFFIILTFLFLKRIYYPKKKSG